MSEEQIIENALAHYGVKGMRWGFRKSSSAGSSGSGMSTKKKVVIGAGAAVTVAGGLIVANHLRSGGKMPVTELMGTANKLIVKNKYGVSNYGSEAAKAFERAGVLSSPARDNLITDAPKYVAAQREAAKIGRAWVASADASSFMSRPLTDIYSPEVIRRLYG